jgi:hypothetical protein
MGAHDIPYVNSYVTLSEKNCLLFYSSFWIIQLSSSGLYNPINTTAVTGKLEI